MNSLDTWLIPFRFNAWATRDMLERCRVLNEEQLHRRFDIGPGSLHDTFRHIVGAMQRWSDRIAQRPLRESIEKDPRWRTVSELEALLDEAARDLEAVARDVYENQRFDEMIEWPRPDAPPYRFHKTTALVHVTTHGMHHRAQIRWMMRHLGMDLAPDWDAVEWEAVQTGQLEM